MSTFEVPDYLLAHCYESRSFFDVTPEFVAPELPRDATIQERFAAFHAANPWVYNALRDLALDLLARGRTHIGIGMLWEVLRWHFWRETLDGSSDFKLNDHYRSRYARLLAEREPELAEVFELRSLRSP